MTIESAEPILETLPRLINLVEFSQPIKEYRIDLFAWATMAGRDVRNMKEFMDVKSDYVNSDHPDRAKTILDFEVAMEVLNALSKAEHLSWAQYESLWRFKYSSTLGSQSDDFTSMRALHDYFGGILLENKVTPYLLIIPQIDGSYIQMGYESLLLLSENPLGEKRQLAQVLKESYIVSQRHIADD